MSNEQDVLIESVGKYISFFRKQSYSCNLSKYTRLEKIFSLFNNHFDRKIIKC